MLRMALLAAPIRDRREQSSVFMYSQGEEDLRVDLRDERLYGLVGTGSRRFHILRPASFPAVFECGVGPVGELVDFYPMAEVCANCIRVVEAST
jgi:hypothetical protein